jgi:hypothetical protein
MSAPNIPTAVGPPLAGLLLKHACELVAGRTTAGNPARVATRLHKLACAKAVTRAKTRARLRLKRGADLTRQLARLTGSKSLVKVASDLDAGTPLVISVIRRFPHTKIASQLQLVDVLAKLAWAGEDQSDDPNQQQGRSRFAGGKEDGLSFMKRTIGF